MIYSFKPGDLVVPDRPDPSHLDEREKRRLGIILGHIPGRAPGNPYACTALCVMWLGKNERELLTVEVDHRVKHVPIPLSKKKKKQT